MTQRPQTSHESWNAYLERFHAERPGITERILSRCRAEGLGPYEWCAQPLEGRSGPMLDIACGSAPIAGRIDRWIGTDSSSAELARARALDRGPLIRASATGLPIPNGVLSSAVCSMAMQIIDPVTDALSELARVLRPGGRAVLLLPTSGPLPRRHALTYVRLQVALRQRIRYPNDGSLRGSRLEALATGVGMRSVSDERCGFWLPLDGPGQVDELLESLYLPAIEPHRLRAARAVLAPHIGGGLTVPLRRVVLERPHLLGSGPVDEPGSERT